MGAIPVTSRHPNSSFPEVCGGYDLGPPVPKAATMIQNDPVWFGQWVDALVEAASTPPARLAAHRRAMVHDARETFDWRTIVATWHAEFVQRSTAEERRRELDRQEAKARAAVASPAYLPSVEELGEQRDDPNNELACAPDAAEERAGLPFNFGNGAAISGTRFKPVAKKTPQKLGASSPLSPSSSPVQLPSPPPQPPPPAPASARPRSMRGQGTDSRRMKKSDPASRRPVQSPSPSGAASAAASATAAATRSYRCTSTGSSGKDMAAGQRAYEAGSLSEAVDCFVSAAEHASTRDATAEAWYMAGGMFVVGGRSREAMDYFERALAAQPTHARSLFELGNAHLGEARPSSAVPLYRRAAAAFAKQLKNGKRSEDAHLLPTAIANLGNAFNDMGRRAEALAAFERAAATQPATCLAFNGLSNALEGASRFEEAQAASRRGTHLLPDCEYAHYNLGRLLRSAERSTEAVAAFEVASRLQPSEAMYVNGLGTALHAGGRTPEATSAYLAAVKLKPGWSSPYRNLGLVFNEAGGRAREAIWWFGKTVELEPTSAETYCDLGTSRLELGEQLRALEMYRYALVLAPDNALAHVNEVHLATKLCDWEDGEGKHRKLLALLSDLLSRVDERRAMPLQPAPHLFLPPYHALAYDRVPAGGLLRLAAAYAERAAERTGAAASPHPSFRPSTDASYWLARPSAAGAEGMQGGEEDRTARARRLVVGYLTTDFGEHPTSHLMRSVWRIQKELGHTRAVCFARSNDRSQQRAYIASTCEEFVELTHLSWVKAAAEIRKRRVAILVDLNGHCGRPQFELLSLRPAPLAISYMGHPGTSGAEYVPYLLTDRMSAPPQHRRQFSEHLLSLHAWHVTNYRFSSAFDSFGPPPEGSPPAGPQLKWPKEATRQALGLPPHGAAFVFATFSQLYKVTPPMYSAWANALKRSAVSSRLWMLEFPRHASEHLGQHAAADGVRKSRLLSAPTAERSFHLARVSLADLFLDTTPYNGHTTTGDATWMGTPSLTLPGELMQSRVAAGYAANAGCPQLIARSYREYENLASAIATRPAAAAAIRDCLARNRWTSTAFDTRGWVRSFDAGARMMWEVHRLQRKPMHLLLPNARHLAGF